MIVRRVLVPPFAAGMPLASILEQFFAPIGVRGSDIAAGLNDGSLVRVIPHAGIRLRDVTSASFSALEMLHEDSTLAGGTPLAINMAKVADICTVKPPEFPILYEDENYIGINKPPGILVHPSGGLFTWTVIDAMRSRWNTQAIGLCHRLDKDTSGILLASKSPYVNSVAKAAFLERRVSKTYVALVEGCPLWATHDCTSRIGRAAPMDGQEMNRMRRGVVLDPEDGQHAQTLFRVLERFPDLNVSQMEAKPLTGRTHQIRCHLSSLKHSIVGDVLYAPPGREGAAKKSGRQRLHALKLSSDDGYWPEIEAPLPKDMLLSDW